MGACLLSLVGWVSGPPAAPTTAHATPLCCPQPSLVLQLAAALRRSQAAVYAPLGRGELDVWEALGKLDTLREYETALLGDDDCDPSIGLVEHALQTAEACR